MYHISKNQDYSFVKIAESNDRFTDFAPYVSSVNNNGIVSFQAALGAIHSGIFKGDGTFIHSISETKNSLIRSFCSHPDLDNNSAESICFYAELKSGARGVYLINDDDLIALTESNSTFKSIGPCGPTINDKGSIAFRAELIQEEQGVFSWIRNGITKVAGSSIHFKDFFGLPVINNKAEVLFRADLKDGTPCICIWKNGSFEIIADTNDKYCEIGSFPDFNDSGAIVFSAKERSGCSGIFTIDKGNLSKIIDTDSEFESFRGALINNHGDVIFFATPKDERLGIFNGPDPVSNNIISIGDRIFDSEVADFALNPVSFNDHKQIAVRIKFANNNQAIVRADPNKV